MQSPYPPPTLPILNNFRRPPHKNLTPERHIGLMQRSIRSIFFTLVALILAIIVSESTLHAVDPDPRYTSWLTNPSGTYARLYESTTAQISGTAVTTWSRGQGNQSTPTYAGVNQVSYSNDWVYIRGSGLGFHTMGPWYLNEAKTNDFPNYPANTDVLYRIPRTPTVPTNKTLTNAGAIGYFVDGVAMFDYTDTFSYSTSNGRDASPVANIGRGDGVWIRDAYVNEGVTFDPAFAHQAGSLYHYHANAPALRHQLGDNVTYDATAKTYSEDAANATKHSPIVAWARDGFPVYGPYGYADANDASSGIRRMISGYIKRDGTLGTTDLNATGRTTLPAWAATAQDRSATLATNVQGPAVNATYTLGHYLEDYDYLGDLGQTQGTDFDLDLYNGRTCVTPEFPDGTYAYFLSIETDGTPKFPYIIGRYFNGAPAGESVNSISETVTEYVRAAPTADLIVSSTTSGTAVDVAWNSVEGATYSVESSADQSNWTTLAASVASSGLTTTYSANPADFYRVTLASIASYDTSGTTGTAVGSTGTVAHSTDSAPAITANPTSPTVATGGSVTLSVSASGTGPLTYQWSKDGTDITGATSSTYSITTASSTDAGSYTATVTNALGSATSVAGVVSVTTIVTPTPVTRITNLSTRAKVGGEAGTPVIGLVIGGTGTKSILARAVGPTLGDYGVSGVLSDPELKLQRSSDDVIVAYNDDWGLAPNSSSIASTTSTLGAFDLVAGSSDAAWYGDLATGGHTAPILDDRGEGIVLLEVYDAGSSTDSAQFTNASTRAWVGTGDSILITGFVLAGTESRQVLLRAVGPTLADFDVTGSLSDPTASLYSGDTLIAFNDNWGDATNATQITAAATNSGAFALPSGSADSALLVELAPGAYTLQVAGVSATTGTTLVEVYLID